MSSMPDPDDKIVSYLANLWPYISGIFLSMVALTRLWWYSRQEMKRRMAAVEVLAESNDGRSKQMLNEIKELRVSNDKQHSDILDKTIALFNGRKG